MSVMARVALAVVMLVAAAVVLGLLDARQEWPPGIVMLVVGVQGVVFLVIAGERNVDRMNPFRRRSRSK